MKYFTVIFTFIASFTLAVAMPNVAIVTPKVAEVDLTPTKAEVDEVDLKSPTNAEVDLNGGGRSYPAVPIATQEALVDRGY
uniref:Uncharacterized protein n=1 Tax=Psilocybe cubensis TaxID=181762 RepID=A0A8H8CHK8_PSICU